MFQRLQGEGRAILQSLVELAYFMRGAVQYNDLLLTMSAGERDLMSTFITNRLKIEGKSPNPVY